MIPELGYGATVAALALALWGIFAAATGGRTGRLDLLRSGERAAIGVWILITACLQYESGHALLLDIMPHARLKGHVEEEPKTHSVRAPRRYDGCKRRCGS